MSPPFETNKHENTSPGAMVQFPSPLERIVASALLLLSGTMSDSDEEPFSESESFSLISGGSRSSLITDVSSSEPNFGIVQQMKFKVSRKSRSKHIWRSEGLKTGSIGPEGKPLGSDSTEVSCSSTSISGVSSARSCPNRCHERVERVRNNRQSYCSNHIRRRAQAILQLLSGGCFSEFKIRQMLGDSPDTSKALRMLLRLEEVKRMGSGGRLDPYIYTIA